MPITYRIDHVLRLVDAAGHGTFTDEDVFGYQRTVWSRPDVSGYDELMDMTDVKGIVPPSVERVRHLASVAAEMESSSSHSKFAIVAPTDIAFGLGRMFQAFRESQGEGTRNVRVFRTKDEAMVFLGITDGAKAGEAP